MAHEPTDSICSSWTFPLFSTYILSQLTWGFQLIHQGGRGRALERFFLPGRVSWEILTIGGMSEYRIVVAMIVEWMTMASQMGLMPLPSEKLSQACSIAADMNVTILMSFLWEDW